MKNGKHSMRQNSITERWEADVQSYKKGAQVLVSAPQCETCINYIKGNAFHCKCYDSESKPKYVLFHHKECPAYDNNHPIDLKVQSDSENKLYGGLFGVCVGDAIGLPVKFSTREERKKDPVKEMRAYGTYHQPFGTWLDDTSLILCLILIAFYGIALSEQELIMLTEDISSLTQRDKHFQLACIFYVEFASQIILGYKKEEALDRTIAIIENNCATVYKDELSDVQRILSKEIVSAAEDEIKSTGYVIDTLEAALWTFFHTDGYRNTILKAINLGGDTDTVAAIAGGIAGIYYGVKDIPTKWLQGIVKKEELYKLFKQLYQNIGEENRNENETLDFVKGQCVQILECLNPYM